MLSFDVNADRIQIMFDNKISECLIYHLIKHIQSTKLYYIDKNICKSIFVKCCEGIVSKRMSQELLKHIDSDVQFKYPIDDSKYLFFKYYEFNILLNKNNFYNSFNFQLYIEKKMNKIYWEYIDLNIDNSIKYRLSNSDTYVDRIKKICTSISNTTNITTGEILYCRYKDIVDPFLNFNSFLSERIWKCKVYYKISLKPRPCSFGHKCKNAYVFIRSENRTASEEINLDLCLCNKHRKFLIHNFVLKFENTFN